MTMPKRINPSQEKLHRVKTRTGDTQSGYLEEKLAGSRYVNIIEEDGASGKRLRIELDGASVSAEISDHKVKVDNADTAEYLENKITAGDNIVLSKETSGGKKNIKVSALVPDVVNLKNVVYVDPSLSENITGLAYKTYVAAINWINTQSPSADNRFAVLLPSGEFDQNIDQIKYVDVIGNNTVLTGKVTGYNDDSFEVGNNVKAFRNNISFSSYITGCVVKKTGGSLPGVLCIKDCIVSEIDVSSNPPFILAERCVFDNCNFDQISAFVPLLANNCTFRRGYYRAIFGRNNRFISCKVYDAEVQDSIFMKEFPLTNPTQPFVIAGNLKLDNCTLREGSINSSDFSGTYESILPTKLYAHKCTLGNNETNDRFIIYCNDGNEIKLHSCTCNAIGLDKTTPTEGTLETQDCILNERNPIPNNVVGEWNGSYFVGDIEKINKGAFVHSHIANLINASEKCIAIEIQEADLTQGNTIKATKKLPANCMITKMMYVGDIEFISNNGTLRVGLLSGLGDKGAVIGSIPERDEATEIEPFIEHKAVTTFTLDTTTTPPTPIEPEAISAGSEVAINVELDGGHPTGNGMIYIFYCVPMY
jgi:hypothetical protein